MKSGFSDAILNGSGGRKTEEDVRMILQDVLK